MHFLLLQICCGTFNHILLKLIDLKKVHLFSAIVANYVVCVVFGLLLSGSLPSPSYFLFSFFQGLLLFSGMALIGIATARSGVSITALCARLNLLIPVIIALTFFGERVSFSKVSGVFLALVALALAIPRAHKLSATPSYRFQHLPALLVLVNGGCYLTLLKYVQTYVISAQEYESYVASSFLFALLCSAFYLSVGMRTRELRSGKNSFFWGALLGINNFGAVYFMLRALGDSGLESSVIFPITSVGVLIVSTISARVFFLEPLGTRKTVACILGCLAVVVLQIG